VLPMLSAVRSVQHHKLRAVQSAVPLQVHLRMQLVVLRIQKAVLLGQRTSFW